MQEGTTSLLDGPQLDPTLMKMTRKRMRKRLPKLDAGPPSPGNSRGDAMCQPVVFITNLAGGRRQSSSNATHDNLLSAIAKSSIQIFRAHCCSTRLRYCENHSAYSAKLDLTLMHKVQHDSNRLEDNRVAKTCTNTEGISLSSVLP